MDWARIKARRTDCLPSRWSVGVIQPLRKPRFALPRHFFTKRDKRGGDGTEVDRVNERHTVP